MVVAIAAPSTPYSGIGPKPKINMGSRIIFNPFDKIKVHIEIEASPVPLKIAFIKNNNMIVMLPPKRILV